MGRRGQKGKNRDMCLVAVRVSEILLARAWPKVSLGWLHPTGRAPGEGSGQGFHLVWVGRAH